jgi:hypothetical protein
MSTVSRIITKSFRTIQHDGPLTFMGKAARNVRIRTRRMLRPYHYENMRRWRELRHRFKGTRAFLIGNGPSLNVTPLHLLEGEYTMCFNRFNLMYERLSWRPSMYMNIDAVVVTDMAREIHDIIESVPFAFFPDIHNDGPNVRRHLGDAPNIYWIYPGFRGFYDDLPNYGLDGTVAFPAIQTLVYLGFDPIYLIGVDVNYRIHETAVAEGSAIRSQADDDPNHFDPRYFGAGRRYHQPDANIVDNIRRAFALCAEEAERRGVRIFNAGIGGRLESFPRLEFRSLFVGTRDEAWERQTLLAAAVKIRPITAQEFFESPLETQPTMGLADAAVFALRADHTLTWAPRLIATHVPLGPLPDGRTIFVRRAIPA